MPLLEADDATDAVRELGNVAFSHAATALATLLHRRVDVSIPNVHVLPKEKAAEVYARDEGLYVVSFRLAGDHTGVLAVVFPGTDAGVLLGILHGRPARVVPLDADEEGTLREVGNIMAGSALLAMHRMLGTSILHSTPALHRRTPVQLAGEDVFPGPVVLVLEAEFALEGRRARGTMVISPSDPLPLLSRLGIRMEGS